jgi:hypothetical protein
VSLLLKRDAAITHDKRGFSPLSYDFEKYNLSKHGSQTNFHSEPAMMVAL